MSLRLRLIVLFTTMIVGVASLQTGLHLWSAEQASSRFNQNLLDNYQGHWSKVLELQSDDMKAEQKSLMRDRDLLKALRKEQGEAVKESAVATFNRLSTSGIIDTLEVYFKSGNLAYANLESNRTISMRTNEALQSQEVRSGLLISSSGDSILEVAFPLYYRGKLIGAAQYGKNLSSAIEDFSQTTSTTSLIVLSNGKVNLDPESIASSLDIRLPENLEPLVYSAALNEIQHLISVLPLHGDTNSISGFLLSAKNDHSNYEQVQFFRAMFIGVSVAVLIFSVLILNITLRSSLKPLATAIKTLRDIEDGDFETQAWKGNWKGEFAELMAELGLMQQQLLDKTQNEQRYAEENNRTIKALDSVSNAVVVSGANDMIVYANPAAVELMRSIEVDVQSRVPSFDANKLLGSNIDLFSLKSADNDAFSDDQKHTSSLEIVTGDSILEFVSSPVCEQDGQRIGTVVEWRDLTLERKVVDEVKNVVADAQSGNLKQRIALEGKDGVFLELSKSTNDLIGITEAVINDTARVLAALAEGSLNENISNEYSGAYGLLKDDANRTVQNLREVVSTIHHSTTEVQKAAEEIDSSNHSLGARTEQTANQLQETSASIEEMTAAVQQNAENSERANNLVSEANTEAHSGGQVVHQAMTAMDEINDSSSKIADITNVINDIAFQTNLLALNAAVESARAGEHGKGFAVVASEVRNLASRCSVAAKEIKGLIAASIDKVEKGQQLVNQSGATLNGIVASIEEISSLVSEISVSGKEQAIGLEKINEAIAQIDSSTQKNAAMVKQVSVASSQASRQANELNDSIAFFSIENNVKSHGISSVQSDAA